MRTFRRALDTAMLVAFMGAAGNARPGAPSAPTLTITPTSSYDVTGVQGGPFTPAQKAYSLQNIGSEAVRWAVVDNAPWIALNGNIRGILQPGQSKTLTFAIVPQAAALLSAGVHHATVSFVDLLDSSIDALFAVNLSIDSSGGWTEFVPSNDTRKVYVSRSTGDDAADGLTPSTPKATIAAGVALMRHTFPDWLLLKTGDVWQEPLGQWKRSGRSADERMVITSYGTSTQRPLLQTGTGEGISSGSWGGSPPTIDHVALVGIRFMPHTYSGSQGTPMGIAWRIKSDDFLVEDCLFEGYYQNIVVEPLNGRSSNFRLRRSVIVDAFTTSSAHAQGIYLYGIDDVLIEGNVFDHNGWRHNVAGAGATIFRHNVYVQSGTYGVRVLGNIISNGASHGLQLRSGGVVTDNLFVRNSVSLLLGGGTAPDAGGVTADASENVILDGKNIDANNPRGWGIDLTNIATARIASNIIANQTLGGSPIAINLYGAAEGVRNTTIADNIIRNWGGPIMIQGGPPTLTNTVLVGNIVQDFLGQQPLLHQFTGASSPEIVSSLNVFYDRRVAPNGWMRIGGGTMSLPMWKLQVGDDTSKADDVRFVDPTRSVASYSSSIGGQPSLEAFLVEARRQSRANWRAAYTATAANDYVQHGFTVIAD